MKRTGEMLKKAREAKGLSLQEIALSLKINIKTLTAVENAELDNLPAKTFLRGFVQSYANYLKINSDEVLAVFSEEMGSTRPSPKLDSKQPAETTEAAPTAPATESAPYTLQQREIEKSPLHTDIAELKNKSNYKVIAVSVLSVFLLVLIVISKKVMERYEKEATVVAVEVPKPLEASDAKNEKPETNTEVRSSVEEAKANESDIASQPVSAPQKVEAQHPIIQAPVSTALNATKKLPKEEPLSKAPAVTAAPKEKPAPQEPKRPETVAQAETKPAPPPAPAKIVTPPAPEKKPEAANAATEVTKKNAGPSFELMIEATEEVKIEITNSNGKKKQMTLAPSHVHVIKGKAGLSVDISNGGAVSLTLNGKDMGAAGPQGQPIKLKY